MIPPMAEEELHSRLPLSAWVGEGLRAGFLLRPRIGAAQPAPAQLVALIVASSLLELVLGRFEVAGDARFELRGWLLSWWNAGAMLLLAWWALPLHGDAGRPHGVAAWFALWMTAIVPVNCLSQLVSIAQAQEFLPEWLSGNDWRGGAVYAFVWLWLIALTVRLTMHFGVGARVNAALTAALALLFALSAWQFPDRAWQDDTALVAADRKPLLEVSQATYETQQAIWRQATATLAPQRPGVVDLYGIVFSPYADDEVFLRESTMVTRLLEERFDGAGRVLHMANHSSTADSLPWATPLNLQRGIAAVAEKMDREHDVLFIYLTSHGANDFKLAASNPPLEVDTVSPGELRQALDNAGVRNRIIVVSACYSGGWVGPVADEHTLVMTAADGTHTSFGCGSGSELTFFGRALFDEQLRHTHSFEQAFAKAAPVIQQREQEAGKSDGFSNPQLAMGSEVRPVLRELEQRLDAAGAR